MHTCKATVYGTTPVLFMLQDIGGDIYKESFVSKSAKCRKLAWNKLHGRFDKLEKSEQILNIHTHKVITTIIPRAPVPSVINSWRTSGVTDLDMLTLLLLYYRILYLAMLIAACTDVNWRLVPSMIYRYMYITIVAFGERKLIPWYIDNNPWTWSSGHHLMKS